MFNLLNDFSGMQYIFFGNFMTLRPEVIVYRLRMLAEIVDGRLSSMEARITTGLIDKQEMELAEELLGSLQIWVIVSSDKDKSVVTDEFIKKPINFDCEFFSYDEVKSKLEGLS